jgi:hypothetical protein
MMNTAKLIGIVILIATLLACEAFFATKLGRWNPQDPANELEKIAPSVDGYVFSAWVGDSDLKAEPGVKTILLRFDTSELPDQIDAAYLDLFKTNLAANDPVVRVHRIIEEWDTATISFTQVDSGSFVDPIDFLLITIPKDLNVWIRLDLTDILQGSASGLTYGIAIYAETTSVDFDSSGQSNRPTLLVQPGK